MQTSAPQITRDQRHILQQAYTSHDGKYWVSVLAVREKRGDYTVCQQLEAKGLGTWDNDRWFFLINKAGYFALMGGASE